MSTGHESGVYCNPNQSPIDNDRLLFYITTGYNFPKFHYATLKVLAGFRAVYLVKGGYLFLHGITLWGKMFVSKYDSAKNIQYPVHSKQLGLCYHRLIKDCDKNHC